MSHPNPTHDRDNEYPADKVTHYPKTGHKRVADFHKDQMSHMMGLVKGHMSAKTKALKKRAK